MSTLCARGLACRVGDRSLFQQLDLTVSAGEALAVMGPSGSGKTLLLRILADLDPRASGSLTLDGQSPEQLGGPAWRRQVCLVAQQPAVLDGSPADLHQRVRQLASQREAPGEDPLSLAASWGLPQASWQRPWVQLSGGERQRAALALALSRRPAVLLLDEPTSALDAEARAAVEASLRGHTLVVVTHEADQVERLGARCMRLGP